MKMFMLLVAAFLMMLSMAVRGEETAPAAHQNRTHAPMRLERACGSCHGGATFLVTGDADFHRVHGWELGAVTNVADPQKPPAETVKAPFLGVGVEKPSETLRVQLGLQEGVGLVVNVVVDDSPAKAAGVRQHDVLHKLDDQLLVNEEQLVTLVRLRKTGDSVTLGIIRGGKPTTMTVRLGEKEVAAAAVRDLELTAYADLAATFFTPTTQPAQFSDALNAYLSRGTDAGADWMIDARSNGYSSALAAYTTLLGRSVSVGPITVDDGSHVIIFTPKDGGLLVAMEKSSGTILFNGPVATDEQWHAVPDNVKQKMQELHESFRRGKEGPAQTETKK